MGKKLFTWSKKDRPNKEYDVGEQIGSGQFSQVFRCSRQSDSTEWALKKIAKKGSTVDEMVAEVEIMHRISHPNCMKLEDVFETDHDLYLVLELATGGELFDQIVERSHYSEKDTAALMTDILKCLQYIHGQGVVHRDLKPENLLYSSKTYTTIKIADFGLAKEFEEGKLLFGVCGTPGYMAPEMVHFEGYSKKADVFSMGVILYILLCGFPPFGDDDFEWQFLSPEWDGISAGAKDLVKKMLAIKPTDRPDIDQCLQHEWLRTTDDRNMKEAIDALKKFNARRRFRKGITAVRTTNFLKKVIALKTSGSQSPAGSVGPASDDDVAKFFRVYDNELSSSLKKLESASVNSEHMLAALALNPELSASMAPAMANIFKQMTLYEKDFKAFRKAYAKAFLPKAQEGVAEHL